MLIGACLPELIPGTEVPRGAVRNSGPHPGVFLPKTKAPPMLIYPCAAQRSAAQPNLPSLPPRPPSHRIASHILQ